MLRGEIPRLQCRGDMEPHFHSFGPSGMWLVEKARSLCNVGKLVLVPWGNGGNPAKSSGIAWPHPRPHPLWPVVGEKARTLCCAGDPTASVSCEVAGKFAAAHPGFATLAPMAHGWWRKLEAFVVGGSLKACAHDEIFVTTTGIVWPQFCPVGNGRWLVEKARNLCCAGKSQGFYVGATWNHTSTPSVPVSCGWWRRPEACAVWGNLFLCLGATMKILRSPREFRGHTPG